MKAISRLLFVSVLAMWVFLPLDSWTVMADIPVLPPIQATSTPSVAVSSGGTAYAFVRGNDNALWWSVRSGDSWTIWETLGGALTSAPDCVSPVSSTIICVVRGLDNGMWVKTAIVTGNGVLWGDWQAQGGILASGPALAAATYTDGHIELQAFVKGPGDALWSKRNNGTVWGNWIQVPGVTSFQDDPDCTWHGSGEFDCVVRGQADNVLHNATCCLNVAGAFWEDLEGNFTGGPSIASRDENSLDVFVYGANDHLWWRHAASGRWSPWSEVDAPLAVASGPDCVATSANVVLCAFLTPENAVGSLDLYFD